MNWMDNFDDLEKKYIDTCILLAKKYPNTIDGDMVTVAKMATMISNIEFVANELANEIQSSKPYGEKRTIDLSVQLLRAFSK